MLFQKAFKGNNHFGLYIIMVILVIIGYSVGQAPMLMALWKAVDDNPDLDDSDIVAFQSNPDFSVFGINTNLGLTLLLISFIAAFVVMYFLFKPLHKREFKSLISSHSSIRWNRVFFAFGIWLLLSLVGESISYFQSPESYSFQFKINTFIPLLLLSIFILPIQTSFEEVFFRGYLLQGIGITKFKYILAIAMSILGTYLLSSIIKQPIIEWLSNSLDSTVFNSSTIASISNLLILLIGIAIACILCFIAKNIDINKEQRNNKIVPLLITSILFGLVHSSNPEIEKFGFWTMQLYYLSAGLLLGIITIMDDGLELALGVHAATNFTSAVFVGYDGGAIITDSVFVSHAINPLAMTFTFIALAIIFIIIVKYKYGWQSFSKLIEPIIKPKQDFDFAQSLLEQQDSTT